MTEQRSSRIDLPLLLLVSFLLQIWMLDPRALPTHDTFYSFANFHVFYSHLFFEWDLVHWLPYGTYGMPAALQQVISLGPLDYVAGCVGTVLRVHDAMLLFKLARIGDVMVFAFGIWMLARRLFTERATAIALGIAAAGTTVWYAQVWFDLRFYYLLPLVLYCVHRFLDERRPVWFWLAGVTSVAWSVGNVPYFIPLWGFSLLWIVVPIALGHGDAWARLLRPSRAELLWFALFAASAAIFVYVSFDALNFLVIRESGRDALTRKVDVETFRTWGGNARLSAVAQSFLLGSPVHLPWGRGRDNSAYVGLLPLVGLVVAIARERSAFFLGLVLAAGSLVWLSLGGVFAALVYRLPLLSEYRHVGLVYGIVKTCVILAGGYGIDRLWRLRLSRSRRAGLWLVGLGVAGGAIAALLPWSPVLVRICLYATLAGLSIVVMTSMQVGLLIALVFDLGIYQSQVRDGVPELPVESSVTAAVFDVSPLPYQAERLDRPEQAGPRAVQALEVAKRDPSSTTAWNAYAFAQFDACTNDDEINTDTFTYGVDTLVRLGSEEFVDIRSFLSCGTPKLRLVSGARIAQNLPKALGMLARRERETEAAPDVIRLPPGQPAPVAGQGLDDPGSVQVTRFTPNELVAEARVSPPGAWLIYSDAFHPRWTAWIDGRETFIAEANLAFKAVWVGAGDHVVHFRYGPRVASDVLAAFALLSGVGALGWIAAVCVGARSERSPRCPER